MNNAVKDIVKKNEGTVTFIWHPGRTIRKLKVFQVYGFCVNSRGKVCLVRDKDEKRFTLPGGHVDPGETAVEALKREFEEETQFLPENIQLLGSLEVKVVDNNSKTSDHHQQVRFVCSINNIPTFIAGKKSCETAERIFVQPHKLPGYIEWISFPTGKAQFSDFLKYLDK